MKKLSNSLENKLPDKNIAADYMELAREFNLNGERTKAENYYIQAVNLYSKDKDKVKLANAYRELARTQENLEKFDLAILNYENAAKNSTERVFKKLNENDVQRLKNRSSPRQQAAYLTSNLEISKRTNNKDETAIMHQQMAQVKIDMNDNSGAIDELNKALKNVEDKPAEVIKIQQDIANTYVADKQYDEAIKINETLVEEARQAEEPKQEVNQLQNLANIYLESQNTQKAIESLKQAYEVAISSNQTLEARNILLKLVDHYRKNRRSTEAINLYNEFLQKLDTLVKGDSTLIDDKFFQLYEDRIIQLEKERTLTEELIIKKNRFNYVLQGSICLVLVFLGFIVHALYSINKRNKKIALQALRREMNPHFIFNSLNSVNQFIAQNNELEANKYLSSYSRLMRNIMENSSKDFISLATETEQLKEYLELEHMRFGDKFDYSICIDESLDADAILVPNMIIQPQLENAIWHGLRYKEGKGNLTLKIERNKDKVYVIIEDDGIGLEQSRKLKTVHQKHHNSRGLTNTRERIRLLNELYNMRIVMNIEEKNEEGGSGVKVTLIFPWTNKTKIEDEHSGKNKKRNR